MLQWFPALGSDCLCMPNHRVSLEQQLMTQQKLSPIGAEPWFGLPLGAHFVRGSWSMADPRWWTGISYARVCACGGFQL